MHLYLVHDPFAPKDSIYVHGIYFSYLNLSVASSSLTFSTVSSARSLPKLSIFFCTVSCMDSSSLSIPSPVPVFGQSTMPHGALEWVPLTELTKLPHVGLHTDSVVGVLLQVGKPDLDCLRVAVSDLDETSPGDTLKVLL
jgi:hypothetical protein